MPQSCDPAILLGTEPVRSALLPFWCDLPQIILLGDCHPSLVAFEHLGYAEAASTFPPLPHSHAHQPCPTSVAVISSSGLIFHQQKARDLINLVFWEGEFEWLFHLQNILEG